MNVVFLIFFCFLNLFKMYSFYEIKLSFFPKDFYIGTNEKSFSLKTFPSLFSSVNFGKYLGEEFYGKIQEAAIMRTYCSPLERKATKVKELNKKKNILELKFPVLLLYAENNKSSYSPFIKKPGLLNKIDATLSSLPTAQKIINVSQDLVQNYNTSIGTNFKIMAQEFTMHNLLFKLTLGGSIISSIVLGARDIISVEKLRKSTIKVLLFLIVSNFVIYHWRKFYYGVEYVRHAMCEKKYTKNSIDFLEYHEEKIFRGIQCLEVMLIFLYTKLGKDIITEIISKFNDESFYSFMMSMFCPDVCAMPEVLPMLIKDIIIGIISRFKNESFYSLIKENLVLLNEHKLNSAMFFAIFPLIVFQQKLLSLILSLSKKIEQYLISEFKISENKKEVYNSVDGFFSYIEAVLYQENPQIAESDFDSLVLKIKQNIENQREVLRKSERTDIQDIAGLENILNCFNFSVINDVTSDEIKVYDFKKRVDDFILVQKLLLLCKICLHESFFDTIQLEGKDAKKVEKNDLLVKIHELCEKLAKEEDLEETRKVISQTIISLFNIIQRNKEKINENQDNFWYVEELVDDDFFEKYPNSYEHLKGKKNLGNDLFSFKFFNGLNNFVKRGKKSF